MAVLRMDNVAIVVHDLQEGIDFLRRSVCTSKEQLQSRGRGLIRLLGSTMCEAKLQ